MPAIVAEGLTKTYRRFEKAPGLRGSLKALFHREMVEMPALADLTLSIEPGAFVALIGPNGAGKTTLVKLLTGIIAPSSGHLSVLGHVPSRLEDALKRRYALVMGQKSQLFFELTPADTFELFRALYEIPRPAFQRSVDELVTLFDVGALMNTQVRTLSLGERMKMELIAALLHGPDVLFLDEPTIGLDAVAQRQIRAFLKAVNAARGVTILLTSHYMEDIRALCPRSVVLAGGRKIYDGPTGALFDAYCTHRKITVTFPAETAFELPDGAVLLERGTGKAAFLLPKAQTPHTLEALLRALAPQDIVVEEEDIGGVVERIYQIHLKAGEQP